MKDEIQQERTWAVQRFLNGEKPESICASLCRSKAWLYKWVERHIADDNSWSESQSRRPLSVTSRTPKEIEEIVKMVRLNLYNRDLFCGTQAIRWEMEELGVRSLPSLRTINRILSRNELTHRRTGRYEAKGTAYPKLPSLVPQPDPSGGLGRSLLSERAGAFLRPQHHRHCYCPLRIALIIHQGGPGHPRRFMGCLEAYGNAR